MRYKAQFFDTGLSHEHSVEWIAVNIRQLTAPDGMPYGDWQGIESAFEDRDLEIVEFDFNSS